MRLDLFLSESRNISRNRAKFLIDSGIVSVQGKIITKASYIVENPDDISVQEDDRTKYVARSAVKLDKYLALPLRLLIKKENNISIIGEEDSLQIGSIAQGAHCLDVGSSTGGFVQVLLKYGAKHVTALDVGTMQLHESLRGNPQITSIENMDFRDFDRKNEEFDVITTDVSFISIIKLLPAFVRAASEKTQLFLLFKPQFEVGPENLTKQNLPKSEKVIQDAMSRFREALNVHGFIEKDCQKADLKGEVGNQEWVFWVEKAK